MLEVINDALAIEEVHGGAKEIPIQRFGETQTARAAGDIRDRNDFFEGDDLDSSDDDYDVDVAGEHGSKEDANHHEGPDGAGDESLLLLFEF